MKKFFALFILLPAIVFSQSAGTSGLSFLKIGYGARNMAMGDLGVAGNNDVTSVFYNPALLADYESSQIFVSHNKWIQDVNSELLGVSFTLFQIPFAIGLNTTSVSDIEVRTAPGEASSTFNANYFFASLTAGIPLGDNYSAGLTMKYLYEGLYSDESTGFAVDIGFQYSDIIDGLSAGAAVRNLGSMNDLRNQATKLPVDLRAGLAYKFSLRELDSDIKTLAGVQKYTTTDDIHIHTGVELQYDKLVSFRVGYITGYESKAITTGIGLYFKGLNFDYAYIPFDYSLGDSHVLSLMYTF